MKKKILSVILVMAMILMLVPIMTSAASDITGHWAEEALSKWAGLDWLKGDGSGNYRPADAVSRAEFMAFVNRMKGFNTPSPRVAGASDVKPTDWYYQDVAIALEVGYIKGYEDGTIRPNDKITRQEAMTAVARLEKVIATDTKILDSASDGAAVDGWEGRRFRMYHARAYRRYG